MRQFFYILIYALLLPQLASPLYAQEKIAIEDFTNSGTFIPQSIDQITWMRNGTQYSALENNKIVVKDLLGKQSDRILVDGNTLSQSLIIQQYTLSADERKVLLLTNRKGIYRYSYTAIFYLYDLDTQVLNLLSTGRQAYATFSPQGDKIAYTQNNNLFYYNIATQETYQITADGKFNEIINGSSDWVYEEELVMTRAFSWSAQGTYIAYLRFDESQVQEYTLQYWTEQNLYPYNYSYKYPKAGEDNAQVTVHLYNLTTKTSAQAKVAAEGGYFPSLQFTQDKNILSVEHLNRLQNVRKVIHISADTGSSQVVLEETDPMYVDYNFCNDLRYLANGKHFVYSSERSGFKHFYLYTLAGKLVRAITQGEWEAQELVGINEDRRTNQLYYLSTESGALERHLYRIDITGKNRTRLTTKAGVHKINMSRDFSYYIDYHSSAQEPPQIVLYATKTNAPTKVLEANVAFVNRIKDYKLVKKSFFSFPSDSKELLYGYLLMPKTLEEGKKYPVLVYQYSGPGAQIVRNEWSGSHYYFHQMLVQQGYIVAVIDTRGTGARGADFKKITYGQMGRYESEDLVETAKYLSTLDFVDTQRVGIWGWSYGGYMSSLSLFTAANHFSMAMAIAPVASWRFYDTIYTERYLKRPQDNPEGYDAYSPLSHVSGLQGKYLLVHGTGDDNVHFQNAVALQEALVRAGKTFNSFYYPNQAHGLGSVRQHLYGLMLDFIQSNL